MVSSVSYLMYGRPAERVLSRTHNKFSYARVLKHICCNAV